MPKGVYQRKVPAWNKGKFGSHHTVESRKRISESLKQQHTSGLRKETYNL
jgi:hypothetical protein